MLTAREVQSRESLDLNVSPFISSYLYIYILILVACKKLICCEIIKDVLFLNGYLEPKCPCYRAGCTNG